jgi:hypothetical protein
MDVMDWNPPSVADVMSGDSETYRLAGDLSAGYCRLESGFAGFKTFAPRENPER